LLSNETKKVSVTFLKAAKMTHLAKKGGKLGHFDAVSKTIPAVYPPVRPKPYNKSLETHKILVGGPAGVQKRLALRKAFLTPAPLRHFSFAFPV
jgi:hypothetical protein